MSVILQNRNIQTWISEDGDYNSMAMRNIKKGEVLGFPTTAPFRLESLDGNRYVELLKGSRGVIVTLYLCLKSVENKCFLIYFHR
jgi:hypothetical protein